MIVRFCTCKIKEEEEEEEKKEEDLKFKDFSRPLKG